MLGLLREWIERLDGTDKQKHFFDYLTEQTFNDFLKALSEITISCNEFVNSLNEIKRGSI